MAGFEKRYHGVVSAFMFATETQQTIGEISPVSTARITCIILERPLCLPFSDKLVVIT